MPVIAMINPSFAGDTKSVEAVAQIISPDYKKIADNDQAALDLLEAALDLNDDNILIVSGSHGHQFLRTALQNEKIKTLIANKRLVISWSGHQAPPNLTLDKDVADNLAVVAVLEDYIKLKPEIAATFGARLLPIQMVPNTLNKTRLAEHGPEIIAAWNAKHAAQPHLMLPTELPKKFIGYMGVIIGGDAPDIDGQSKRYGRQQAYLHGYAVAQEAKRSGKMLLITNSPRTGQIYAECEGNTKPVLLRYTQEADKSARWLSYGELTDAQREDPTANPPDRKFISHATDAPLDPISQRFLDGIRTAKLPKDQLIFIDFKYGDSAYEPIAAAIYPYRYGSTVYYTGESISQIELGSIFTTYVFSINSMSALHESFLQRMRDIHRVGIAALGLEGVTVDEEIDLTTKAQQMHITPEHDAHNIANAIKQRLALLQEVRAAGAGKAMVSSMLPKAASAAELDDIASEEFVLVDVEGGLRTKSAPS